MKVCIRGMMKVCLFMVSSPVVAVLPALALANVTQGQNCTPADLTGVTSVPIQSGAAAPAGSGGELPSGRWVLMEARYSVPFGSMQGTARGVFDLKPENALEGWGSLALHLELTAPVSDEIELEGAGWYVADGSILHFGNECGDESPIDGAEYSVLEQDGGFELTVWTEFVYNAGFPIVVNAEARFRLEEVAAGVLAITPSELDFGTVDTGDSRILNFAVSNAADLGSNDLELSSIEMNGDVAFAITGGDCGVDTVLAPQQSCMAQVSFSPGGEGDFTGHVGLTTADGQSDAVILSGAGDFAADDIFSDRFQETEP